MTGDLVTLVHLVLGTANSCTAQSVLCPSWLIPKQTKICSNLGHLGKKPQASVRAGRRAVVSPRSDLWGKERPRGKEQHEPRQRKTHLWGSGVQGSNRREREASAHPDQSMEAVLEKIVQWARHLLCMRQTCI